jgi:hypothetical protein
VYAALGDSSWEHALDLQVMQKVLPRLHGARRKLEPLLTALGQFCFGLTIEADAAFDPLAADKSAAILPMAFDKVQRMTANVRTNQFASFAE